MLDDVSEQFEQINTNVAHFWLRIKGSAAILVEYAQLLYELFILGRAIDGMLDSWFRRGHFGTSRPGFRRLDELQLLNWLPIVRESGTA